MAIKNKDGSVYTLNKPNPIMINQDCWSKTEKYTLHNRIGNRILMEIPEPAVETPKPKVTVEGMPSKPKEEPEIHKIAIWCLPANIQETVDPLYQEKYQKIVYGNKFVFEGVIEDQQDLYIRIWTDLKIVTLGSVLYPMTFDKRWWRVENIEKKDQMYLLTGMITDYHPEFSD